MDECTCIILEEFTLYFKSSEFMLVFFSLTIFPSSELLTDQITELGS